MESILECSKRTVSKIAQRMNLSCFECGWNLCVCDFHHILPQSKGGGDEMTNLTYLCPNCHRAAHAGLISNFRSAADVIGESWKDYYNVTSRGKNKRVFTGKAIATEKMQKALELGREKRKTLSENRAFKKIKQLELSNLDTTKYGWVGEAAKILNIAPQSVVRYLRRHAPHLLDGAKSRKKRDSFRLIEK